MVCKLLQETVSIYDACKILGCSRVYLYRLKNSGELPYTMHAGKVRIYVDGIEAYCDRQRERAFRE